MNPLIFAFERWKLAEGWQFDYGDMCGWYYYKGGKTLRPDDLWTLFVSSTGQLAS